MTIQEMAEKGKNWLKTAISGDLFIILVIVFVGVAAFGLGRLSAQSEKEAVRIIASSVQTNTNSVAAAGKAIATKGTAASKQTASVSGEGKYVASKNGTAFYLVSCSGASRIKEENKIWFDSVEAAEEAGYHKASNCKGL